MNYLTFAYLVFWALFALADPVFPDTPEWPVWFQLVIAALAGVVMQLSRLDIERKRFRLGYLGVAAGVSAAWVSLLIWGGVSSPFLALPVGVGMGWAGVKGIELLEAKIFKHVGMTGQNKEDKEASGDNDRG